MGQGILWPGAVLNARMFLVPVLKVRTSYWTIIHIVDLINTDTVSC